MTSIERKPAFPGQWLLLLLIFVLALLPRVLGLAGFLTADEPLWIGRARHFVGGVTLADYSCPPGQEGRAFATSGIGCTLQTPHPGVTTMGAGSLGLLAYYWQAIRPTGVNFYDFLASINTGRLAPELVAPVRLPLALIAALFVCLFYLLLRRLLSQQVALVAGLLLALSPFHIALSRIVHHDALATTFMNLSLLTLIGYWLRGWRWYWLPLSAGLAGLACLSKASGWFMLPYAGLLAGVSLLYRWRSGQESGWSEVWRVAGAGFVWVIIVGLTYLALFPAMWVIPDEVLRVVFRQSVDLAEDGHGYYFFGQVGSGDPGPLFYPLIWLLQVSPLEILGALGLGVAAGLACWRRLASQPSAVLRDFGQLIRRRPVELALALFVGLYFIFITLSAKKLSRYALPAFPPADIFVAFGLLWLYTNTWQRFNLRAFKLPALLSSARLASLLPLVMLILFVQGWLVLAHYPYYFTYFNPLLGGGAGAARMITVGWGGGMNEAAAYLNQQPQAQSLQVVVCGNSDLFNPFFVGETRDCEEPEIMGADYVVYYRKNLQLQKDQATAAYFAAHYPPAHRVTLGGLDYALIYRNPIEYRAASADNSLPDVLTTFGYNLTPEGNLTLFWRNIALGQKQLLVGLISPADAEGPIHWVLCTPAPGFETEAGRPGAIVESVCPLAAAFSPADGAVPELYDVRLGLGDGAATTPINSSGLALVALAETGQFTRLDPQLALAELAAQALPGEATPLDIAYGDRLRLVGYQLQPAIWQLNRPGEVVLYWQPVRHPDFGLASAIQLVLRLSAGQADEPLLTVIQPLLPASVTGREWGRGAVMPVPYPLSIPATVQPGQYTLDVCLAIAGSEQLLPGAVAGTAQPVECWPLSLTIAGQQVTGE